MLVIGTLLLSRCGNTTFTNSMFPTNNNEMKKHWPLGLHSELDLGIDVKDESGQ